MFPSLTWVVMDAITLFQPKKSYILCKVFDRSVPHALLKILSTNFYYILPFLHLFIPWHEIYVVVIQQTRCDRIKHYNTFHAKLTWKTKTTEAL